MAMRRLWAACALVLVVLASTGCCCRKCCWRRHACAPCYSPCTPCCESVCGYGPTEVHVIPH